MCSEGGFLNIAIDNRKKTRQRINYGKYILTNTRMSKVIIIIMDKKMSTLLQPCYVFFTELRVHVVFVHVMRVCIYLCILMK
jgi:hypothetical protein